MRSATGTRCIDTLPDPRARRDRVTLTVNYRTPAEIMDVANRLLAGRGAGRRADPGRCAAPAPAPRSTRRRRQRRVGAPRRDAARRASAEGGTVAVIAPVELHAAIADALADVGAVADDGRGLDAPVGVLTGSTRRASSSTT